jgi:hypothetical protein
VNSRDIRIHHVFNKLIVTHSGQLPFLGSTDPAMDQWRHVPIDPLFDRYSAPCFSICRLFGTENGTTVIPQGFIVRKAMPG